VKQQEGTYYVSSGPAPLHDHRVITFIFNEFVSSSRIEVFLPLEIVTRSTLIKNGSGIIIHQSVAAVDVSSEESIGARTKISTEETTTRKKM